MRIREGGKEDRREGEWKQEEREGKGEKGRGVMGVREQRSEGKKGRGTERGRRRDTSQQPNTFSKEVRLPVL